MDRYETVEVVYEQYEELDAQLYALKRRGWIPRMSRNFRDNGDNFSELITFEVYSD